MTVVVAFLCTDGVVVASDSMITTHDGGDAFIASRQGIKVKILNRQKIFAFAGDLGLGERFQFMVERKHTSIDSAAHPIEYPLLLTKSILEEFASTQVINPIGLDLYTVLAYIHNGEYRCCIFDKAMQPRLLNKHDFYESLGSGKALADPFLRFLVKAFCQNPDDWEEQNLPRIRQPNVRDGVFLATWAIEHVIETNPGGVAGPIQIATLERGDLNTVVAEKIPYDVYKLEHRGNINSAFTALRTWRKDVIQAKNPSPRPTLEEE